MDLQNIYGYSPSHKGKRRRRRLKTAIQDSNFDRVFEELRSLQDELKGYKSERARQDLKFLKERKDRYFTEKKSYRLEHPEVAES